MSDLTVKELTPSLRDDFLLFFDNVAFADNPDWSDCYCYAYHFSDRGKAENRRAASNQIEESRIQDRGESDPRSRRVGSKDSSPTPTEILLAGVMQLTPRTTL